MNWPISQLLNGHSAKFVDKSGHAHFSNETIASQSHIVNASVLLGNGSSGESPERDYERELNDFHAITRGVLKMMNGRLGRLKTGAVNEAKKMLRVFLYLWVFLTVLALHKAFVFDEDILTYQQGFALINAFALAKIVVVGQQLQVGERITKGMPLVFPILFKAAIFGVILIGFHVVEETLVGTWHGKTIKEAVPTLGDGSLQAILMLSIISFVAMIPFFGFQEIERVIGEENRTVSCSRQGNLIA